ncbi:carboxypeptidase-like regulatory domain-containing protein [Pelomicrobium sp. G1]|uniref:carboxypeptidase-like regulatory domain-containing protein n=1 Tax=unclassified Pelomicrobium TaxID=2815318 RepID=UPI003F76538A
MRRKKVAGFGLLALGLVAASAAAQEFALPPERSQGSVTYLTGGVGKEESDAIKRVQDRYPLSLLFVERGGPNTWHYLANVRVSIQDAAGKSLLETTAEGPFLLAKLPEGRYTVVAEVRGQLITRRVDLTQGKRAQLVFEWSP